MKAISILGAALLALVPFGANAAVLSSSGGTVKVDTGAGFRPASSIETLKSGDVVQTDGTAKVTLVYDNGCMVPVPAGRQIIVAQSPACPGQTARTSPKFPGYMGAQNVGGAQTANPGAMIVGLGVTGLVFGVIAYKATEGNDRPASP